MSIDLIKVASQVEGMVTRLKAGVREREEHLRYALDVASNKTSDLDYLRRKIAASKTTWLVAGLVDGLAQHYEAPPLPPEFTVVSTDGSHIDVDRHQSTRCYLINIGSITLSYGAQPTAILDNSPALYYKAEDLAIAPTGVRGREQPIEGVLLGIRRGVEECCQLARLATELPPGSSNLALLDGSLILWGLAGKTYPDFVAEALLKEGFLIHLDAIRKLNTEKKRIAIASYISFPRSTDVVNVLRLAICPHEVADCDRYCSEKRDCDMVSGVPDRELYSNILRPGERSASFFSQSSVVQKYYGLHQVYFFYLRVDDEIARIEIPQWVATDETLLNLTHTLIFDQCQRGQGYPVALSEAHEKAVITGSDRQQFWQLVESYLAAENMPVSGSEKNRSKRTKWI
ncbi:DNA double-strand break repair nuclease NurA [Chloroflexota bacterium]